GVINLNLTNFGNLLGLRITDITGKTIYAKTHKRTCPLALQIDLSNQPKGMYFIKIENENKIHSKKILIQ
ncbi:MAG: hypothetical protein DRJ05_18980, partial [Bacteroidetes bacterium]